MCKFLKESSLDQQHHLRTAKFGIGQQIDQRLTKALLTKISICQPTRNLITSRRLKTDRTFGVALYLLGSGGGRSISGEATGLDGTLSQALNPRELV